MLVWKDDYVTGFPEIDDQHKRLFQVINKLGESIAQGKEEKVLEQTLDFLEKYIKDHFGYEEECMVKHKCPVAEKNKKAHERFFEGYRSYRQRYRKGDDYTQLAKDIHRECEDWLTNHICDTDIHLKACAEIKNTVKKSMRT